jgi:hypothetical protein
LAENIFKVKSREQVTKHPPCLPPPWLLHFKKSMPISNKYRTADGVQPNILATKNMLPKNFGHKYKLNLKNYLKKQ